jgi:hypothetical protein
MNAILYIWVVRVEIEFPEFEFSVSKQLGYKSYKQNNRI